MDVISTALTAAWLDAFRRVQAESLAAQHAQSPSGPANTLTEAIEGALRAGGAGPRDSIRPETPAGLVDRLA